jgi:hypothetical protein
MADTVMVKHTKSGLVKSGKYGFSWTYLFFGWFVPLIRGELTVALLHLFFTLVTFGIWQFIIAFLYNKQYTTRLLTTGWELCDTDEKNMAAKQSLQIV